ncbi:hypothetical protein Phou_033750 [Phytohabitans houttuyneae]|uniref:Major facilitator superfamily (MFS) profile domain-containing protein n=1 Tax=Phytohabitans houttuyneae TaxID=1076126 RepID=A0A6V8KEK7_9ACTN|nr:hypothetical protein Phou_033750 [Phytohabitans houttuyneae]
MLRIRPFRRLWMVTGVASLGDWLGLLATATFASAQVSGDAAKGLAFGSVIAVRLLPALVLGPVAGVMADRFDRRYTMVICDLLRFVLFASIPIVALFSENAGVTIGWAAIATFLIETITLLWIPAKEAAVPNLIPRSRLEIANQLTLITTYGVTPVLAGLGIAALDRIVRSGNTTPPEWAEASNLALYFNALSRLAMALVVYFGIKEISGRAHFAKEHGQSMLRQFLEGWKYVGRTPLVRGSSSASSAPSPAAASSSAPPSSSPARSTPATPPSTCSSAPSSSAWAWASRSGPPWCATCPGGAGSA